MITAKRLSVPVEADSIESPTVNYGEGHASVGFLTRDERWGRVTFERLDALRVSRGEYEPYETDWKDGKPPGWVQTLEESPWLMSRYEYEKRHYNTSYNFGGDVEEMLREFSHYVFSFHDEFVEAIAAGIWFEEAGECIGNGPLLKDHPLLDIDEQSVVEQFVEHGIRCQVRQNPREIAELVQDARFCSQKLYQFALDGTVSVSWTLDIRERGGTLHSYLRNSFGNAERTFDAVPPMSELKPIIAAWLEEVRQRRDEMGKP